MHPHKLKAIIFDMDGVLVDSEPLHLLAVQTLLGRYGVSFGEEENKEFLGRKDLLIAQALIARHSLNLSDEEFIDIKEDILSSLIRKQAVVRPGVHEVLSSAQALAVPMAVASSATMRTIKLVVETLSIGHFFQLLCSGEDVTNGKPAPDIFLLAAKGLSVAPELCMVIEDGLPGLTGARAAGMYCVSIPCAATAYQDHSLADLRLASLEDLRVDEIFRYNSHAEGMDGQDSKNADSTR